MITKVIAVFIRYMICIRLILFLERLKNRIDLVYCIVRIPHKLCMTKKVFWAILPSWPFCKAHKGAECIFHGPDLDRCVIYARAEAPQEFVPVC